MSWEGVGCDVPVPVLVLKFLRDGAIGLQAML